MEIKLIDKKFCQEQQIMKQYIILHKTPQPEKAVLLKKENFKL